MIDILLVDDHELVRAGLCHVLRSRPGFRVVGEAATGEQAIEMVRQQQPDVVLMDINMPGIGGIVATRRILAEFPSVQVMALTSLSDAPFPASLHEAGALGYLSKGCQPDELFQGIETVIQGRPYLSSDVAQKLSIGFLEGKGSPFMKLSAREKEVVMLVLAGHKPLKIAEHLGVSPKSVSTYRRRIFEKLEVDSDVGLTLVAVRHGLLADEMN